MGQPRQGPGLGHGISCQETRGIIRVLHRELLGSIAKPDSDDAPGIEALQSRGKVVERTLERQ